MIEILDSAPDVNVQPVEYMRLLGYPRGHVLGDRAKELADWARDWYSVHGRPWVYARQARSLGIERESIFVDGVTFTSARLRNTLEAAGAHDVVLVAVSAGPELESEAQLRWHDGKPDEYFFLEIYGSAVVEHLVTTIGARLCAWAETDGLAVLPHYSPGYPEWTIDEQPHLLRLIAVEGRPPFPLEALDSGMLRPKKSLLAVFGLTRHTERVRRLTHLSPCENCSFAPCQFRRAPYRRARQTEDPELADTRQERVGGMPLDVRARYTVGHKALRRWSQDRLSLAPRPDGGIEATFRYDGTTCTNMGRPLRFLYHVTLGPPDEGYPVLEQWCEPAPGDEGYTSMCGYLKDGEQLLASIARECPLHGQRLDEVLVWARPSSPAGCYCDSESRQHKWGLVLETIHFTLAHQGDAVKSGVEQRTERS